MKSRTKIALLLGVTYAFNASLVAQDDSDEDVFTLSPFVVDADPSDSYEAVNTTSITGVRTTMDKLPITADIMTQALLNDISATSDVDLLRNYVAGAGINYAASGASSDFYGDLAGDRQDASTFFTLRGLGTGGVRRNGFLGFFSNTAGSQSYSMNRFEIIRGPQALLYGSGTAAGAIVVRTKQPIFDANSYEYKIRIDDEGSMRNELDANYSFKLGGMSAALRLGLLDDRTEYWRDGIEEDSNGVFANLGFKLNEKTTLKFEYQSHSALSIDATNSVVIRGLTSDQQTALGIANNTPLNVLVADGRAENLIPGFFSFENSNSIEGNIRQSNPQEKFQSVTLEASLTDWLSAQFVYADNKFSNFKGQSLNPQFNFAGDLRHPDNNPTGDWAIRYQPLMWLDLANQNGYRGNATAQFDLFEGKVSNTITVGAEEKRTNREFQPWMYYRLDANGDFDFPNGVINNFNAGRVPFPAQFSSIENGSFGAPFNITDLVISDSSGNQYRADHRRIRGIRPEAANNPFGLNFWPGGGYRFEEIEENGIFATWFASWFNGRVDTLYGIRRDKYDFADLAKVVAFDVQEYSRNAGIVFHIDDNWSLFAGKSDTYLPPIQTKDPLDELVSPGNGEGEEYGIKFNFNEGQVTGSFAIYDATSKNEPATVNNSINENISPRSELNGGKLGNNGINFDRLADGYELMIVAKPTENWRMRFSFAHTDGTDGSDVLYPHRYNDQFHTTTVGGEEVVAFADGSPVMVLADPADTGSGEIPLSVAMLGGRADNAFYTITVNPTSGGLGTAEFNNADALALYGGLVAIQNAEGRNIGTGNLNLPISEHQLGWSAPDVVARRGGEVTTGYYIDSFTWTNMYDWTEGSLKGFRAGATARWKSGSRAFWYNQGGQRRLHALPDQFIIDLILGYSKPLNDRVTWSSQINIQNLFDESDISIFPRFSDGIDWNARLVQNPRLIRWTNSFRF